LNDVGFNSDEAVYSGQAASIAADPELKELFPTFRAHPLLFQSALSIGYQFGVSDLMGRLLAVAFGVATVYITYRLGSLLYGRRAGVLAALFMALMPYHVIVSRQVLLDAPMTFFATLALYFMARYNVTQRSGWLYAVAAVMGLTFLSKETGVLLLGAIYAFIALNPDLKVRIKDIAISAGVMALVIAPFPISMTFAGRADTGGQYFIWQLFRRPNHDWAFYPSTVPEAIGPLLILAAVAGFWLLRGKGSWRETLLLSWIAVPIVFFQLWPVKGFQYLLPIAPAVAILAARTLTTWSPPKGLTVRGMRIPRGWIAPLATALIALTLLIPSWQAIQPSTSGTFLAGSGGVPGGREAGWWMEANIPEGAKLMTVGPSMANILQFYGHREALGLSVSPNPLHRNPSYEAIINPDQAIRSGDIQYLVWDSFSASRSTFFSDALLRYADRYNGRIVHIEPATVDITDELKPEGAFIVIYEVRP
jgi:4-amino-4-deoxy-L-arabinose transferase-like glycosyltransferase